MTLELFVMWIALMLLAGIAMKVRGYGKIRDIVFGLVGSVLLTVAFLAAAWGSGSSKSWGLLRARGCLRRLSSRAAGRPS